MSNARYRRQLPIVPAVSLKPAVAGLLFILNLTSWATSSVTSPRARRTFTAIQNKTTQTIARITSGQTDKSGKQKFNRLKAKAEIGYNELSITKNASIPM